MKIIDHVGILEGMRTQVKHATLAIPVGFYRLHFGSCNC